MKFERSRSLVAVILGVSLLFLGWAADFYFQAPAAAPASAVYPEKSALTQLSDFHYEPGGSLPQQVDKPSIVWLAAVGDIMLSRTVADKISKNGADYPFLEAADWLSQADIVFGNLETPLTPGRRIKAQEMVFRADPALADTLKDYNFSVLSLANNHLMNFGEAGLTDTLSALKVAGIAAVGAGQDERSAQAPVYLDVKGRRFAFLAYNDNDVVPSSYGASAARGGTAFMDLASLEKGIEEAKEQADFVVVSMHSGREYEGYHSLRQQEFARAAIDFGAELVLGHHPHVIQDYEVYQGKYIFYSLGNFIFDQMWSQETREGMGVRLGFTDSGVTQLEFQPFLIADYSQPRPLSGEAAARLIERAEPVSGINKKSPARPEN